jgi:hypothetical protein
MIIAAVAFTLVGAVGAAAAAITEAPRYVRWHHRWAR